MALERQVEAAQAISRQAVGAALQNDGARAEVVHYFLDDGSKHGSTQVTNKHKQLINNTKTLSSRNVMNMNCANISKSDR